MCPSRTDRVHYAFVSSQTFKLHREPGQNQVLLPTQSCNEVTLRFAGNTLDFLTKRIHIGFVTVDLDPVDLQILTMLLSDGRATATIIADKVGLSRPAVADRIEKLERNGVIRGHTVVVDPKSVGKGVTAFIAARKSVGLDAKSWKAFQEVLRSEQVIEAHTVAGDDCYLLKVRTDSIGSLTAVLNSLTAPPLSLQTRTTIVLETHCEKVGGIVLGEES